MHCELFLYLTRSIVASVLSDFLTTKGVMKHMKYKIDLFICLRRTGINFHGNSCKLLMDDLNQNEEKTI